METDARVDNREEAAGDSVVSAEAAASAEASTGGNEAELERLRADLATARTQADEHQRKYLMALADLDNFRKLSEKRTTDRLALGKKSTIGKFLPVLDNLRRALAFETDAQGLRGGLQATMRGFESLLASESVTALVVVGAPFDPRTAEAISTRDSSEHDDDVVLEEVEQGYRLGEDLLRPAKVIVARRVESAR